jgi:hypothetical protein
MLPSPELRELLTEGEMIVRLLDALREEHGRACVIVCAFLVLEEASYD